MGLFGNNKNRRNTPSAPLRDPGPTPLARDPDATRIFISSPKTFLAGPIASTRVVAPAFDGSSSASDPTLYDPVAPTIRMEPNDHQTDWPHINQGSDDKTRVIMDWRRLDTPTRTVSRPETELVPPRDATMIVGRAQTTKLPLPPRRSGDVLQDRFELKKPIARGGFSFVYYGLDRINGNTLAIKEACPAHGWRRFDGSVESLSYEDLKYPRDFLLFEALWLSKCEHEGVVPVLDLIEDEGNLYLVMPFIQGEQLDVFAQRNNGLSQSRAMKLIVDLSETLHFLHSKDLIHCDIKPSNIFVRSDGPPVLIDFGSAATLPTSDKGVPVYSPGYSPHELRAPNGDRGQWTDVYSLSATLCSALLTESPPKEGYQPEDVDRFSDLPSPVRQTLARSLSPEIEQRPASIEKFLEGCELELPSSRTEKVEVNSLFISYSKADSDRVLPLVEALQLHGVSVWIDRQGIPPGKAWAEAITRGLRTARFFMVFCSKTSMTSENVENEIYLANSQKKPILAAMLEPVDIPDTLALFLAKGQHFDFASNDKERFVSDVLKLLS